MLFQTGLAPLCIDISVVQESTYICCRGHWTTLQRQKKLSRKKRDRRNKKSSGRSKAIVPPKRREEAFFLVKNKNFSCTTSEHATSFWHNFCERCSKSAGHIVLPPPWWWSSWLKRPDTVQVNAVLHHAGWGSFYNYVDKKRGVGISRKFMGGHVT